MTALGGDTVREAEQLQLDGFLMKPVARSMLVDTLMNVCRGVSQRAASETAQ